MEELGKEKRISTTSVFNQSSVLLPAPRGAGGLPSPSTGTVCCDTSLTSEGHALAPHPPDCPSLSQKFLPLQIFHAAAVVVSQPNSVKKIQLIWAL